MKEVLNVCNPECNHFFEEWQRLFCDKDSPLAVNHTQDRYIARAIKAPLALLELIPMTITLLLQRPMVFARYLVNREEIEHSWKIAIAVRCIIAFILMVFSIALEAIFGKLPSLLLYKAGDILSGKRIDYDAVREALKLFDTAAALLTNGEIVEIHQLTKKVDCYALQEIKIPHTTLVGNLIRTGKDSESFFALPTVDGQYEVIGLWTGSRETRDNEVFDDLQREVQDHFQTLKDIKESNKKNDKCGF